MIPSPSHPQYRMRRKNLLLVASAFFALLQATAIPRSSSQAPPQSAPSYLDAAPAQIDSDQDGLSDQLEQALLVQFAPRFFIGQADCSNVPAEFQPGIANPEVQSENGTIYGQVFPAKQIIGGEPAVEIHYYHLWRIDCGRHGHPLDTEHVAVLVRASGPDLRSSTWKALYWYAAAHENTVCDVSQMAHASALHAQDAGAAIWISPAKHASYLDESLCRQGCGADRCEKMIALAPAKIVNLGEVAHPMNGSLFISSTAWPLADKMAATNFPPEALARLSELPDSQIAWFRAGKHPAQGVIAISSATGLALATSGQNTITGINTAAVATDTSITAAQDSTGNALQKTYHGVTHALGATFRNIGKALAPPQPPAQPNPPAQTRPQ